MIHKFYSPFPPEELPQKLKAWIARENARSSSHVKMSLKQRGNRLTVCRTESYTSEGAEGGVSVTSRSARASASVGISKEWYFANPFCGCCLPDGAGGSVLQGKIVFLWFGWALFILVGAVFTLYGFFEHPWAFLGTLLTVGIAVRERLRAERTPGSQAILAFLEECFSPEEERKGE